MRPRLSSTPALLLLLLLRAGMTITAPAWCGAALTNDECAVDVWTAVHVLGTFAGAAVVLVASPFTRARTAARVAFAGAVVVAICSASTGWWAPSGVAWYHAAADVAADGCGAAAFAWAGAAVDRSPRNVRRFAQVYMLVLGVATLVMGATAWRLGGGTLWPVVLLAAVLFAWGALAFGAARQQYCCVRPQALLAEDQNARSDVIAAALTRLAVARPPARGGWVRV